jgi:hypothetical protein
MRLVQEQTRAPPSGPIHYADPSFPLGIRLGIRPVREWLIGAFVPHGVLLQARCIYPRRFATTRQR